MKTKNNRQFARTHQRIVDAVLEALSHEDIRKVTVTKICTMLHINRSTFYEHFTDVYDVMEQTERTLNDALTRELARTSDERGYDELFGTVFAHVRDHRSFYRLYFAQGGILRLSERVIGNTVTWLASERDVHLPRIEIEYRLVFFAYGMNALLRHWLERDCCESIDEMLGILFRQFTAPTFPDTGDAAVPDASAAAVPDASGCGRS